MSKDGFTLRNAHVVNDILIPRYYDPRIAGELSELSAECNLVTLRELVAAGHITHSHGSYVPKIHYGTGPYPYIRTSDLANWEIKASPKHGVPLTVLQEYEAEQDVRAEDILFVQEGTYLIGAVGMVTEYEGKILYQHHLAKFSVHESAPFDAYFLLAALEAEQVHRQIRSKQFSADIIDSVVGRLEEVVIPYPKDKKRLHAIQAAVKSSVLGRARLRQKIARAVEELDKWILNERTKSLRTLFDWEPSGGKAQQAVFLGGRRGFTHSCIRTDQISSDVLLPKYYDPWVAEMEEQAQKRCELRTVADLVAAGILSIQTGDEIGRLNYGTGSIPFVRTSDFGSWELKREAKQGVSREVWEDWASRQDAQPGDILLVRDGTYLVGTSIMVCEDDLPLLYCGGIYKIRSLDHDLLPPGLLFALLNTPFLKRQIKNKQFTRDVIDTLGQRISELVLPIPKKSSDRALVGSTFSRWLDERTSMRTQLGTLTADLFE